MENCKTKENNSKQRSYICHYCGHRQARVSKTRDGFVIRCSYCREFLAGFDSELEAIGEWNQLRATITNLAENVHKWEVNGICHVDNSKPVYADEYKLPIVFSSENT